MARAFSIVGDSISTFEGYNPEGWAVYYQSPQCETTGVLRVEQTWWHRVIAHFGGTLVANASYSGSMVEGAGFPAACAPERIAALAPAGQKPTDVLVFAGINDYGWGGAANQAKGGGSATPSVSAVPPDQRGVAAQPAPEAIKHFQAAYQRMLSRIREAHSQAQVWCITLVPGRVEGHAANTFAYRLRGIHLDEYNRAIAQAASATGCTLADARAFRQDYEAYDGTHPTPAGMAQLASMVIAAMEGASQPQTPGSTSVETCEQPSCVGCKHAVDTGNTWSCVCKLGLLS
ncbi:MAG: SGNH/GDSL hydrolase family protein [Coriobacteriia bacterium]|nr:SGNH/GDSL hydrolase family protein [Coriobacteriia bacterium]